MNKFELVKSVCKKKPSCFCPKSHLFYSELANTPEFIRRYCEVRGRQDALKKLKEKIRKELDDSSAPMDLAIKAIFEDEIDNLLKEAKE